MAEFDARSRRPVVRRAAALAAGLLIGLGALIWAARGPGVSPVSEHAERPREAPTLQVRDETRPKLGEIPTLGLMGDEAAPSQDRLCSEERVARMAAGVAGIAEDGVFLDERVWRRLAWSGRAGLASFWSKCFHGGAAVHVRADRDGELLAVYDPARGFTSP